jgi:CRP/FNR family transcriptional regulator
LHAADLIRQCTFLRALDAQRVRALAGIGRWCDLERGERVFAEGDAPAGMYVVATGSVRVFKLAPGGKEHVLHLAGPGQTFAEVAVLGRFDCPAHAEAADDARCLLLPTGPLNRLLDADPVLTRQILTGMAGWVRQLVGLLEDIVLRDAVGRVARYLLTLAGGRAGHIELPTMKKDLASHLNLTSETLSRSLRRLNDAGLIATTDGPGLGIVDPAGLTDAADGLIPRI